MMRVLNGGIRRLLVLALFVAVLLTPCARAWAADAVTVDVSPLVPWIDMGVHNALNAILLVIGAFAAKFIRNEFLRRALMDAVKRAADGASADLVAAGTSYANVPLRNVAVANAVAYIVSRFQRTMAVFGLTPESVEEMIHKQLGSSLVADPTVSIAPPAAVASPSPSLPAAIGAAA
jgi:hypothetical protein